MSPMRSALAWAALSIIVIVPLALAAASPLLAWREPIYIIAGFAGVLCMGLLLLQPLLAGGYMPWLKVSKSRRLHSYCGGVLLFLVTIHVAGLWITSPPDVIDALTLTSPTWFSVWGVIAMWAVFATAFLFTQRPKLRLRVWRMAHTLLALTIVIAGVAHAMLIDGTMEFYSKALLCAAVLLATLKLVAERRAWAFDRKDKQTLH